MPPGDPNNPTRRVIDVQMAVPPEFSQVMDAMAAQMGAVSAQLQAILSATPEGRAAASKNMAAATRPGGVVQSGGGAFTSIPVEGERSDGLSEGASDAGQLRAQQDRLIERLHAQGREQAPPGFPAQHENFLRNLRRGTQRELVDQPQETGMEAAPAPGVTTQAPGELSDGASVAGVVEDNDPGRTPFRQKIQTLAGRAIGLNQALEARTGVHLPFARRIEHFVPGAMAAAGAGAVAAEGGGDDGGVSPETPTGGGGEGDGPGMNAGDIIQSLAISHAISSMHRARAEARNVEYGNLGGVQAGFDRPGQINIPGTDIGVVNPFEMLNRDSAFREAVNQRVNVMRLRLKGGINQEQAQAIVGSTAALGWTGEFGQNMAFDDIAPLVQQGQNPEIVARMMDQAARNGNTGLADLRDTLNDLGPSARAAHQSLNEYQQGLDDFANRLQEQGGTYGQGVQTAKDLTTAFGMSAPQMQSLQQSPLVQATAMTRFGAMPWETGGLGTAGQTSALAGGVDMAMRAFQGFRDTPMRDAQGHVIMSGRDRQIRGAAQALGVDWTTVDRFLQGRQVAPHVLQGTKTLDRIKANQGLLSEGQKVGGTGEGQFHEGPSKAGDWVPASASTPGAVKKDGKWVIKATVGGNAGYYTFGDHGRGGGSNEDDLKTQISGDWRNVTNEMVRTARTEKDHDTRAELFKQINAIKGEDDPKRRMERSRRFLSDAARRVVEDRSQENVAKVQFTGAAQRYFQQVESKLPKEFRDSNAGGRPRSETATADNGTDYVALIRAQYGG